MITQQTITLEQKTQEKVRRKVANQNNLFATAIFSNYIHIGKLIRDLKGKNPLDGTYLNFVNIPNLKALLSSATVMKIYTAVFLILTFSDVQGRVARQYNDEYLTTLREEVREMFNHAYDSYLKYAFPYDELRPLSCDGVDTWGSYSLTLIDALDTLAVMGNFTEFRRVVDILIKNANLVKNNINVSVFETNIRIIGGLLSAHLLSYRAGIEVEQGWPCNGPLLELAENVAHKLIAAFDTATGMPYGTVNLNYGVPHNETTVTCTAGVGTFILEFSTLSHLTGDPIYEELAMNALKALWHHRSNIGLVGNHIDIETGRWTAHDAGIGAGVDSYFEYLAKGALFLQKPELMKMFIEYRKVIDKYLKTEDWYMWASMTKGQLSLLVFQSLEAYWPGVLSLIGDVTNGMKSLHNYHQVWKQYGFTPEFYNIPQNEAGVHRESYPLRPELIESVMYLYRATGDAYLLQVGEDILRSIQHSSYTPCGYATIKDVRDHRKDDRMESFFLAETTKYLYLLFDKDNFMHNNGQHGTVFYTPWGECIIGAGGYFFNTEAHPTDTGALHCCSRHLHEQIRDAILEFDPTLFKGEKLSEHRQKMMKRKEQKKEDDLKASEEKQNINQANNMLENNEKDEEQVTVVRLPISKDSKDDNDNGFLSRNSIGANFEKHKDSRDYLGYENIPSENKDLIIIAGDNLKKYLMNEDHLNTSFENHEVKDEDNSNEQFIMRDWIGEDSSSNEKMNFSSLFELVLGSEKRRAFEPQVLLEKIRKEAKYPRNLSWEKNFELLRCHSQPFATRITLNGEFFDYP